MPCFDCPLPLHVDVRDIAIGAVLTQSHKDIDLLIAFLSSKLSDTEARWSIYKREVFAIIQTMGKWRCYLINRPTVVFSDHQPLKHFLLQPKLTAKQQHWIDFLAEFSLYIQYQPRHQNILPDALSYIVLAYSASGNDSSPGGDVGIINTLGLEPSWLSSVAHRQKTDPTLVPYFTKA